MKPLVTSLILMLMVTAKADSLQPAVDAYMAEVTRIVAGALMPALAKHRELGNVTKKFSFRIDAAGRPSQITVSTVPPNKFLDRQVVRVLRGLKFPPIPKNILEKYKSLEFQTEMGLSSGCLPQHPAVAYLRLVRVS
jgi:outer membrane biosynthesis protein TonB